MTAGPHVGKRVVPAFELLRRQVKDCSPEWAEKITGIPATRIRKLADEIADAAFKQEFTLPIPWTDAWNKNTILSSVDQWPFMQCAGFLHTQMVFKQFVV